tara:strand:+ start:309 stop:485 length:177 start_codon:yes stop_codon:yes gene_type:complete
MTMRMTRQHFQFIADVVKTIEDKAERQSLAMTFVHKLQQTNPNFKHGHFIKACNAEND